MVLQPTLTHLSVAACAIGMQAKWIKRVSFRMQRDSRSTTNGPEHQQQQRQQQKHKQQTQQQTQQQMQQQMQQ
jgi:hypothetical protein